MAIISQNQIGLIKSAFAFVAGTPAQALTSSFATLTGGSLQAGENFSYSSDTLTYDGIYTMPFLFNIYFEGSDTSNNGTAVVKLLHNNTTDYGEANLPGATTQQLFSKSTAPSGTIELSNGDTLNIQARSSGNNVTVDRFYLVLSQITGT
jgi:hypothetical protein